MVEMKEEADIEDDAVIAEGKQAYQATVIKLDDTLNERTVIANMQGDTVNV
jgi:NDP-sugar pyrophosphorylase family protein